MLSLMVDELLILSFELSVVLHLIIVSISVFTVLLFEQRYGYFKPVVGDRVASLPLPMLLSLALFELLILLNLLLKSLRSPDCAFLNFRFLANFTIFFCWFFSLLLF